MTDQITESDINNFFEGVQRQSQFLHQVITFEQVNHITGAVKRLEKDQKKIKRDVALQPMRNYNFSGQPTAALMGPNGPIDLNGRILTIESAWSIPESDVDALNQHLHLQPFEKDTPLDKKRERLQKYLGIIAGFDDDADDDNDGDGVEEEMEGGAQEVVEENGYDDDHWSDHPLD